jgi:hypothetical protein
MLYRTFWTERRLTGTTLILGAVLFLILMMSLRSSIISL